MKSNFIYFFIYISSEAGVGFLLMLKIQIASHSFCLNSGICESNVNTHEFRDRNDVLGIVRTQLIHAIQCQFYSLQVSYSG